MSWLLMSFLEITNFVSENIHENVVARVKIIAECCVDMTEEKKLTCAM